MGACVRKISWEGGLWMLGEKGIHGDRKRRKKFRYMPQQEEKGGSSGGKGVESIRKGV